MSRNHYEDAKGVLAIQWEEGEPPQGTAGVILVETWRSSLGGTDPRRSTHAYVQVHAAIEARVKTDDGWMKMEWSGSLKPAGNNPVRRWARLPSRTWNANVTLDGWNGLP